MDFFNIKSSAALLYDEFIQNAGESSNILRWQYIYLYYHSCFNCLVFLCKGHWPLKLDIILLLQTRERRSGCLCRLLSLKWSSLERTFTLSRRWVLGLWRTARPLISKDFSLSTTSVWWLSQSTCAMRWIISCLLLLVGFSIISNKLATKAGTMVLLWFCTWLTNVIVPLLVVQFVMSGWGTGYSFRCDPINFSDSPQALRVRCHLLQMEHWINHGA